jgi:hypothetical protein
MFDLAQIAAQRISPSVWANGTPGAIEFQWINA